MYLCLGSRSHGQATSFWKGDRGAPTECRQGMNLPHVPRASSTSVPVLVMIIMLATT